MCRMCYGHDLSTVTFIRLEGENLNNKNVTDRKTVTITEKEYNELLNRDFFLSCLEGAGVDNWQGYSDACEIYNEDFQE